MTYWDTSAFLKLYVAEHDSPYFVRLLASTSDQISSSAIVTAEALCALYRKEQAGELRRGAAKVVFQKLVADAEAGHFITIPYGREVVAQAETVVKLALGRRRPLMIRTLDAIHIASALASNASLMVATDSRLRAVAELAGLKVLP